MNEETRKLIEALAAKLGTTAEHLWAILLRQAFISFWTDLIFYGVTLAIAYIAFRLSVKAWKKSDDDSWNEDEWRIGSILCVSVSSILIIISLLCVGDTITKIANPEYWALSQVLSSLKSQ